MKNNQNQEQSTTEFYPRTGKLRRLITYCRNEFHRSRAEEWANGISHFAGTIFSIVALVLLCVYAAKNRSALQVVSGAIFGTCLVLLYNNSTLYHLFKGYHSKKIFQLFDHLGIYLLIAGTYTPFALLTLRGAQGWTVFGIVWGLALIGIVQESFFKRREWLSLLIYLSMGWLIIFFFKTLLNNVSKPALILLISGGVSYTVGVIFYVMDKIPYMHTIWHFFVLGGSVCHWISVNFFVFAEY